MPGASGPGRVWGAGDVTGITHTHASHYQARVVAANIGGQRREADYSAIPRCVFTTPSVFAVGIAPVAAAAAGDAAAGEGQDAQDAQDEAAGMPAGNEAGGGPERAGCGLITARADLGATARAYLDQDDPGCLELYADAETGVLAGAVAVGPDAATWMGEVTLAIRAKIPVTVLADVVHAFPTYGEALETALRELARTGVTDQLEKRSRPLSEPDIETPEDDATEQRQDVFPREDEDGDLTRIEVPLEANEANAVEQELPVGFDDDDYR